MRTMKLMAVKPHRYGTRHLTAGEEYEAPIREAVAMVAAKKAKPMKSAAKPAAVETTGAKAAGSAPPAEPSLDGLRLQATQLGINVDGRWGVHRLQQEIEARQR